MIEERVPIKLVELIVEQYEKKTQRAILAHHISRV